MWAPTVAVTLAAGVAAQNAPVTPIAAPSAGDVQVHATVVDSAGALVTDLTRQDFEIDDGGRRRPLTSFRSSAQPINVVILIDRSASLTLVQEQMRDSAGALIAQLAPDDQARVGNFGREIVITPQSTNDREALSRALESKMSEGPTLLWDAVDLAITDVASEPGRRVVLVFTDGDDTGSRRANFSRVVERAQADDVMIYPVGMPVLSTRFDPLRIVSYPPDGRLRQLADQTGGGYGEFTLTTDPSTTFARVADELRRQYLLGFAPDPPDGKIHELRVSVTRPGLQVRAKQRYRAPLPRAR